MKCPFCGYEETKVIDTRSQDERNTIKRRRLCEKCGKRFNTYERVDTIPISVVKRNGAREIFDKDKLLSGIIKSCNKRPVSVGQMEHIADEIENAVMSSASREVESRKIGEMVMEQLKAVDEVAYVRFASVYRQFKDVNTFLEELNKLIHEKKEKQTENE